MTDLIRSSTPILTVAALLGAVALTAPGSADAATVQSYTCADRAQSGSTSASLSLTDPPASVTAGQSLTLQARLTLTLPQSFDLAATADLVSQVGLSTTTFGLQMQIGSTVEVVPAAIVVGQLQTVTVGSSEVASAEVTFPAVTVPRTATGDVVVSMPTAAEYPNSATSSPAEVVFNGVLEQQTYTGTPSSSNLACYDASTPASTAQVVAQIPIQAIAAAAKATTSTTTRAATQPKTTTTASRPTTSKKSAKSTPTARHTANATPAGPSSDGPSAAVSQGATGSPAAASVPPASTAGAPSTAAASPTSASTGSETTAPAAVTPAEVTIPPRTVGSGTFIPTWELILMGSLLPIAAVFYARRMRQTLAAARTDLERRSGPSSPPVGGPPTTPSVPRLVRRLVSGTRESQTRT